MSHGHIRTTKIHQVTLHSSYTYRMQPFLVYIISHKNHHRFNEGFEDTATNIASSNNDTINVSTVSWVASSLELSGTIPLPSSSEHLRILAQSQCDIT